jgi:hypothetical protein
MKHVQKNVVEQINRRNNLRHWKKAWIVFFEISINRKVRQCSSISQKDLSKDDFLKLTFAFKTLSIKNDQLILKKLMKLK